MPFFEKAENFKIEGATFVDIAGNQTNHNYNQSVQVSGSGNSATFNNGPQYHGDHTQINNSNGYMSGVAIGQNARAMFSGKQAPPPLPTQNRNTVRPESSETKGGNSSTTEGKGNYRHSSSDRGGYRIDSRGGRMNSVAVGENATVAPRPNVVPHRRQGTENQDNRDPYDIDNAYGQMSGVAVGRNATVYLQNAGPIHDRHLETVQGDPNATQEDNPQISNDVSRPMSEAAPSGNVPDSICDRQATAQRNAHLSTTVPLSTPSPTESISGTTLVPSPQPTTTQPVFPSPAPAVPAAISTNSTPTSAFTATPSTIEAATSSTSAPAEEPTQAKATLASESFPFPEYPDVKLLPGAPLTSVDEGKGGKKEKKNIFSRVFRESKVSEVELLPEAVSSSVDKGKKEKKEKKNIFSRAFGKKSKDAPTVNA